MFILVVFKVTVVTLCWVVPFFAACYVIAFHCEKRDNPTQCHNSHFENYKNAKKCFRYEIQSLLDFLSAAVDMQHWHFFPALMKLARWKKTFLNIGELIFNCCPCRGAELLSQWEDVVGARETRKLSFASSLLRGVTGVKDFSHTGDHF